MPTTPLLGIQELTTNQSGKEATINNAILALESATNATLAVDMSAGNVTLSAAQFGGSFIFKTTGLTANRILNLPAQINGTNVQRIFAVRNTSAFSVTVQVTGGAGTSIIVPAGETRLLDVDGAGNVKQVALLSSATSVITDATTARAISLTDASAYIRMNNAAANTVTLPSDATAPIPVGSRIFVERMGAGATSFVAGAGATVSTPASLILRAQFSLGIATKVAANTWVVDGDLSGTGIVSVLDDLTDVDTSTTPPADGQALVYNLAATKWKPGSVASGGGGGGGGSMALIQRIVATGTETSIDFTGIPADYKHLRIVACGRTAAAAATDSFVVRLNGDATAGDYQTQQLQGSNAVASAVRKTLPPTITSAILLALRRRRTTPVSSTLSFRSIRLRISSRNGRDKTVFRAFRLRRSLPGVGMLRRRSIGLPLFRFLGLRLSQGQHSNFTEFSLPAVAAPVLIGRELILILLRIL
jgi:hypothetical protein